MPSVVEIELKLGGRLKGAPDANKAAVDAFCEAIGTAPEEGENRKRSVTWPVGLLPEDWRVSCWMAEASEGYGDGYDDKETVLSFTGRMVKASPGQLFRHAKEYVEIASDVLNYPDSGIYWELKRRLNALNGTLPRYTQVVERVWFRGLSVKFDNGGDM